MTEPDDAAGPEWAFDRETAVRSLGPGRFSTEVHPAWNIGDNPNGGYAQSTVLRAMGAELSSHRAEAGSDPVSVTTHFLRPTTSGPGVEAEIAVDVVRAGRRTSTLRASLIQDGSPRLETVATFATLDAESGAAPGSETGESPRIEVPRPEIPEPDRCQPRAVLSQGVRLPLMSRVEVRIVPDYAEPGTADHAATAGWIRFVDLRPPDPIAVPLFADCFPPTLFSLLGSVGWVPTVELTVHVRAVPDPGWIQAEFTTTDLSDGFLIEDGRLWDESGRLVARSRQLALLLHS